ncbi:Bromodomain containing protein [Tritrichomonas foetus]|uniref:Bromodomain containing protein n=1 Tax=Tritrichomonas foetus TaxID=1144522 RepID=A0A1J4JBF7_9EUKA|nr:Bromodomain containing protein [Tritrichomonas foetus]|eukprot:OHS96001.1 Bromodomain containing protein [Tritrichomonas foetus]
MLSEFDKTWCQKLLTELNKMPITMPFRQPVDPIRDSAPNYLEVIKTPMDLSTMKKKLLGDEYQTVESFIDDIKLICDNAKLFNGPNSMYALICDDIMNEVQKQYCEKAESADQEWFRSLNRAIAELQEHMRSAPADVSLSFKDAPMPDLSKLSEDQIIQIESELGGGTIDTLEKKWMFLNESVRKKIMEISQ